MTKVEDILGASRTRRALEDPGLRRIIRQRALLTQQNVADAVDSTRASVSRWESGARRPRGEAGDRYLALLSRLAEEVMP